MRTAIAVLLFLIPLAGCRGTLAGYDPEAPVHVWVQASNHMNTARATGRAVDLFAFRVDDPSRFLHAPVEELISGAAEVPGGVFLERRFVRPGESVDWLLPATATGRYDHIGILATYTAPNDVQRATAKVTDPKGLDLDLGPSDIRYLGPIRHSDDPLTPGSD